MKDEKRWYYIFVLLIGGMIGSGLSAHFWPSDATAFAATHHSRILAAEKFELVAPDGARRGVIQVTPRGTAVLAFYDAKGKSRAEFKVTADGASVAAFFDDMGRRRVVVGQALGDRSGIAIYSPKGPQLAGLGTAPASGQPALALFDQDGKERAQFYLKSNGSPGLAFADASGKTISGLPQVNPTAAQQ